MLVVDLLRGLLDELPNASVGDFVAQVNRRVEGLWGMRRWEHYVSSASVSATLDFDNLTVTNGVDSATVVDGDAGGLFDALHVGKLFTIEGTTYLVESVTDGNTLVLGAESDDVGAALEGSLPRVVFSLPTTFRMLYGSPFRADYVACVLSDPQEYLVRAPVAGVYVMEFHRLLSHDYVVPFYRAPVPVTGPGDTVDIWSGLEEALRASVLRQYLGKVRAQDELDMAMLQTRRSDAARDFDLAMQRALKQDSSVRQRQARNAPGFA